MSRKPASLSTPLTLMELARWIFTLVVTAVAAVVGVYVVHRRPAPTGHDAVEWLCAFVVAIAGVYCVRWGALGVGKVLTARLSLAVGAGVRLVSSGVGGVLLIAVEFAVFGVSIGHLLIGAGVAGIVLGIAAQQSLANVFASLVLLFARPFSVGETVRIRSSVLGTVDARILGIGLTYVTITIFDDGTIKVPNSVMLASAIGRRDAPVTPTPPRAEPSPDAGTTPAS